MRACLIPSSTVSQKVRHVSPSVRYGSTPVERAPTPQSSPRSAPLQSLGRVRPALRKEKRKDIPFASDPPRPSRNFSVVSVALRLSLRPVIKFDGRIVIVRFINSTSPFSTPMCQMHIGGTRESVPMCVFATWRDQYHWLTTTTNSARTEPTTRLFTLILRVLPVKNGPFQLGCVQPVVEGAIFRVRSLLAAAYH